MKRQEFVVNEEGVVVRHESDFEACGQRLEDYVSPDTWPWVKMALGRVLKTGTAVRCIVGLAEYAWSECVLELRLSRKARNRVAVIATERAQKPAVLMLEIVEEGIPVKESETADPRTGIAAVFNRQMADSPLRMCLK